MGEICGVKVSSYSVALQSLFIGAIFFSIYCNLYTSNSIRPLSLSPAYLCSSYDIRPKLIDGAKSKSILPPSSYSKPLSTK